MNGLAVVDKDGRELTASYAPPTPKRVVTYEDALTPEVRQENAAAISALMGSLQGIGGVKRGS